jgi:low temperature requirement protein LtrA
MNNDFPWFDSPPLDKENSCFHVRGESSSVELFFDLFFVANLATFTAHNSIVDVHSLFAYIGFFIIIWTTWFQITLHDVRFAQDSFYERVCKMIQFIVFAVFALVGAKFFPSGNFERANEVVCFQSLGAFDEAKCSLSLSRI